MAINKIDPTDPKDPKNKVTKGKWSTTKSTVEGKTTWTDTRNVNTKVVKTKAGNAAYKNLSVKGRAAQDKKYTDSQNTQETRTRSSMTIKPKPVSINANPEITGSIIPKAKKPGRTLTPGKVGGGSSRSNGLIKGLKNMTLKPNFRVNQGKGSSKGGCLTD
jgi:hypothetical protein